MNETMENLKAATKGIVPVILNHLSVEAGERVEILLLAFLHEPNDSGVQFGGVATTLKPDLMIDAVQSALDQMRADLAAPN